MPEQWSPLGSYAPLRPSEDVETSTSGLPPMSYWGWPSLRRIRAIFPIASLLITVVFLASALTLVRPGILISLPPPKHPVSYPADVDDKIQWSDFAYAQYVTNSNYLCNSLMIVEALHRSGTKADRLIMYPEDWHVAEEGLPGDSYESELLALGRDLYDAKLVPIHVQTFTRGDATWKDSYTKLLAFNQTQYKRIMSLDSDATVRQHMDELFLMPPSPVAMPRAYWLDQPFFSSQLVLISPSKHEWARVSAFMHRDDSGFDMDILNDMYKDSCIVIPHRRYNLITGEFREEMHERYLGSDEAWNGAKAIEEAKFVHFSDWPVPKPWLEASSEVMKKHQPKCRDEEDGKGKDCTDRDIWLELYKDFSRRRKQICGHSNDKR